jgi:glycosyltransferase involved in cell wall biosynthesis
MTDPLGQSQVLPYLEALTRDGFFFDLISFEKPNRFNAFGSSIGARIAAAGIAWHPLPYTKWPPVLSTVWDVVRMRATAAALERTHRYDIVHCRSYIPALVGDAICRKGRPRLIFDMRGFWPDEKVDAGAWRLGHPVYRAVYRYFKRAERRLVHNADAVIVLTHAGERKLAKMFEWLDAPALVVPCSVDFTEFEIPQAETRRTSRGNLGVHDDAIIIAYLGSLGTWYMIDEMFGFFARMLTRYPEAKFLCVTPDDPAIACRAAARHGVDASRVIVRSAQRVEVPALLAAADLGLFFIRPTPSKIGSSPTKLGEYLAMGIPVITNAGVGDVAETLAQTGGGIAISEFSNEAYDQAVSTIGGLLTSGGATVRERARTIYDLCSAVDSYRRTYRSILARNEAA